jgi:hypothetical protein
MAKPANPHRVLLDIANRVIREERRRIEAAVGRGADRPDAKSCAKRLKGIRRELEEAYHGALREPPKGWPLDDVDQRIKELIGTTLALVEWKHPLRNPEAQLDPFDRVTGCLKRIEPLATAYSPPSPPPGNERKRKSKPQGRPLKYPKAAKRASDLLKIGELKPRVIFNKCVAEFGAEEELPKDWRTFTRTVCRQMAGGRRGQK